MNKIAVSLGLEPPFPVAHGVAEIDGHVGAHIHLRRIALSLSREELAECLGVSVATIAKYERGQMRVRAAHLLELSGLLHCTISGFFSDFLPNDHTEA